MDLVLERMELVAAVRQGHRRRPARPRLRHRHQGRDHADHVGRDRQRLRRRLGHALLQHHRHGPGLEHRRWRRSSARCSTSRRRSVRIAQRDTDVTPYDMGTLGSRSTFHMGHAVRLRRRGRARQAQAARRDEVGEPEGSNIPIAELFKKRYGMQAGNVIGSGIYKPDYVSPDPDTGLSPERHAVLDDLPASAPRSRSTPKPATSRSPS